MKRAVRLCALATALLVSGLQKTYATPASASPAPVAAASAAVGAVDDSLRALMREAFTGWKAGVAPRVETSGPRGKPVLVTVEPRIVLPLDSSHRALVVTGVAVDRETDSLMNSHADPANLGVYVFERRDGRWVKTHETTSAGWDGWIGILGELRAVELGVGILGLAVESGSCWQGACGKWLTMYAITPHGTRRVLRVMTSSAYDETEDCTHWLEGELHAVPRGYNPDRCFDVVGNWRLSVPTGQRWADLIIDYTGRDATIDRRTRKPAVKVVNETLVLRARGASYVVLRGRNTTHPL